MYDTSEEVIECLKKLDRLDREFIEIIIQQLESPNTSECYTRFQLVSRPGRRPSIAMAPLIKSGIRRFYHKCIGDGLSSKQAVFKTHEAYGVGRTTIMNIVSEAKKLNKAAFQVDVIPKKLSSGGRKPFEPYGSVMQRDRAEPQRSVRSRCIADAVSLA